MCKYERIPDSIRKIFELEQKKAKKKKEMDALEKEIKQLKSKTSSYMKKRKKRTYGRGAYNLIHDIYTAKI